MKTNYALCFAGASGFDIITDSQVPRAGLAKLVGAEELVIKKILTHPSTKVGSDALQFSAGTPLFSARDELRRLLNSPPVYTDDQLAEAEAAVKRLAAPQSEDELTAWAEKLASDFGNIDD